MTDVPEMASTVAFAETTVVTLLPKRISTVSPTLRVDSSGSR